MNSGDRLTVGLRGAAAVALVLSLGGVGSSWLPSPVVLALLVGGLFAVAGIVSRQSKVHDREARHAFVHRYWFELCLAAICLFAFLIRLTGIGTDVYLTAADVDEGRLTSSVLHFFSTGEIDHTTVEHYPGLYYWYIAGNFLLGYVWGLMSGAGRDIGSLGIPYFLMIGRVAGIVVEAGNVLLTGMIGGRVGGKMVGLLAAAVVAVSPLSIAISTQFRNEPGQLFFILASTYCALIAYRSEGIKPSLGAGVFAGAASGIKYSSVFMLIPALFAAVCTGSAADRLRRLSITMLGFVAALAVTNPFLWLDFSNFTRQLAVEVQMTGAGHWAAVENTGLFYTQTLARAVGWPLLLLGAGFAAYLLARGSRKALILLSFQMSYIWFMSHQPAQFARWVYPVVPLVAILGCWSLVVALDKLVVFSPRKLDRRGKWVVSSLVGFLVLAPVFFPGARDISRRFGPHTATLMAQWLGEAPRRGQSILMPDFWLEAAETDLEITRVPRYEDILGGGHFFVHKFELVFVPEPYLGFVELDHLSLVHAIYADRAWGGNLGFDFFVYQPTALQPSSSEVDIEVDRYSARRFLGPEWVVREPGNGLEIPTPRGRIFFPPLRRESFRVELQFVVESGVSTPGGLAGPVAVRVNGQVLETAMSMGPNGTEIVLSSPYIVPTEAYPLTEIELRPEATGRSIQLERLRLR